MSRFPCPNQRLRGLSGAPLGKGTAFDVRSTVQERERTFPCGLRCREGHRLQPCRNWELFFFSALAAEVRFSFQNERETSGATAQNKNSCAVTARLKSCPSLNRVQARRSNPEVCGECVHSAQSRRVVDGLTMISEAPHQTAEWSEPACIGQRKPVELYEPWDYRH